MGLYLGKGLTEGKPGLGVAAKLRRAMLVCKKLVLTLIYDLLSA